MDMIFGIYTRENPMVEIFITLHALVEQIWHDIGLSLRRSRSKNGRSLWCHSFTFPWVNNDTVYKLWHLTGANFTDEPACHLSQQELILWQPDLQSKKQFGLLSVELLPTEVYISFNLSGMKLCIADIIKMADGLTFAVFSQSHISPHRAIWAERNCTPGLFGA